VTLPRLSVRGQCSGGQILMSIWVDGAVVHCVSSSSILMLVALDSPVLDHSIRARLMQGEVSVRLKCAILRPLKPAEIGQE